MRNRKLYIPCTIFVLACASQVQAATITLLGTLGGPSSWARAVNATGHVVGASWLENDPNYHAFSYFNGTMTDLGTLGGPRSEAYGINSSGVIVGTSNFAADDPNYRHAFVYANGQMTDLGTLTGGFNSVATGINDAGQIVGYSDTSYGVHPFLYDNGQMIDLGQSSYNFYTYFAFPSSGRGTAINASGQVAGNANNGIDTDPFIWSAETGQVDLFGTPAYTDSTVWCDYQDFACLGSANGINDAGQVVGTLGHFGTGYVAAGYEVGTLGAVRTWSLGGDGSVANDVNNLGQVVGWATGEWGAFNGSHAFLGSMNNNTIVDLNTYLPIDTPFELAEATAITDNGLVVGSTNLGGMGTAYLLQLDGYDTPEPGTIGLMLAAATLPLLRRLRNNHHR